MGTTHFTDYYDAVFDTDRERALAVIQRALDDGDTPEEVVFTIVVPGMEKMIGGMINRLLLRSLLKNQIKMGYDLHRNPLF